MELIFTKERIILKKELNALDKFVVDFTSILNKVGIKYVIVSGYVSILFGRSRSSEDVDIIIEKISLDKFMDLWNLLYKDFECVNIENVEKIYKDYLLTQHSVRFSRKNSFIPNMELKFPKTDLDVWSLEERKKVSLNEHIIFISQIEMQISFKVYLGSEKDLEDARHLYRLFKDKINLDLLNEFNRKLKIEVEFNKYIR